MKRSIKSTLVALVVSLSLAAPVMAGPFEDGIAAYERADYDTALRLWRPLADLGNVSAQFNLGLMYKNGEGVPQDYAKALKWYRKAADQGNAGAQTNLGLMYENGEGVPQDYVEAHKWLNIVGTKKSVPDSELMRKARDTLASKMTPAQIAEAQRLAREWKPKK